MNDVIQISSEDFNNMLKSHERTVRLLVIALLACMVFMFVSGIIPRIRHTTEVEVKSDGTASVNVVGADGGIIEKSETGMEDSSED